MNEVQRKVLKTAVSAILIETGFDSADQLALDTLSEMIQSLLTEVGNSSRAYSEHAGRVEPLMSDVILALINCGFPLDKLEGYVMSRRGAAGIKVPPATPSVQSKQLSILQAGTKHPHPSYIAAHLPPFPDPHAYIRTPTHKHPVTEYEDIREKAAVQKRDIERALNKFVAKTSETDSLFSSQDNIFPLIACKPQFPPYLVALLPKDQIFDDEPEQPPPPVEEAKPSEAPAPAPGSKGSKKAAAKEQQQTNAASPITPSPSAPIIKEESPVDEQVKSEVDAIDNPYLRPVKFPPPRVKMMEVIPSGSPSGLAQDPVECVMNRKKPVEEVGLLIPKAMDFESPEFDGLDSEEMM